MKTLKFVASLGLAWTLFVLTILGIMYFNWWRKHPEDNEPTDRDLDQWMDNEKTGY